MILPAVYSFHVTIHARSSDLHPVDAIDLDGRTYCPLAVGPDDLAGPLPVSLDEALEALAKLPQMFCEPDGWLTWTSPPESPRWEITGQLTEHDARLHTVELKGTCPAERFDQILETIDRPGATLVFQLMREGVYFDEAEFRRWASRDLH